MTASKSYNHLIKAIAQAAWAIYPPTLEAILDVVRFRADGGQLTDTEIVARLAGPRAENGPREHEEPETVAAVGGRAKRSGAIAILPIYGIIAPRASILAETSSGGTGLDALTASFRAAMADPEIMAICFDIDSPGGTVDGVEELATEIRNARGQKPIAAVANYMAASAAYYLASQADEVICSPSGWVGSIGVLTAHQDLSEAYAAAGVKTTIIKHGKYKAEANEFEPLSDDAREAIQARVDEWGSMFEASVAAGRGITPAKVRAEYGQGRMMLAKGAKAAGLVDRVDTLEGTIQRLAKGSVKARPASGAALALVTRLEELASPDRAYDRALEAKLHAYGYTPAQVGEMSYSQALALATAAITSIDAETEARTRTTTTTITETVTEDDDEQDVVDPEDDNNDPNEAQETGPTFTTRLQAVTAQAAEVAAIAQSRAHRRTDRKAPLSAAHRTELGELKAQLLATAAAIDESLEAKAQDPDPAPTPIKPSPRLQVQLAAARGGYRLRD